ncbi:hypothetical protein D3C84_807300 [compost metagenome]
MDEERRGAGAGQGGGDLAADMPGLAHADHHHAALAGQQQLAGADEVAVDPGQQIAHGVQLQADGALGRLDEGWRLGHGRKQGWLMKRVIIPPKCRGLIICRRRAGRALGRTRWHGV